MQSLDLELSKERHCLYQLVFLAGLLQVWCSENLHLYSLNSSNADSGALPHTHKIRISGVEALTLPVHLEVWEVEAGTHSSAYWMDKWGSGEKEVERGMARNKRGRRAVLVATMAIQNQGSLYLSSLFLKQVMKYPCIIPVIHCMLTTQKARKG